MTGADESTELWRHSYTKILHSVTSFHKVFTLRFYVHHPVSLSISVPRLGDLLDFGQVVKAFGNN